VRHAETAGRLIRLRRGEFIEDAVAGTPALDLADRLHGEEVALSSTCIPTIWWRLDAAWKRGRDLGLRPCGLGARDSTRTERVCLCTGTNWPVSTA